MPSALRDEELMLAAGRGDTEAFAVLVGRHRERAVRFCFRLVGDWSTAEDLAQDGLVRLFLLGRRYQPRAKFTTLLYGVLKNLCLDELRWRRRWQGPGGGGESCEPASEEASPEAVVVRDEAAAAVRRGLAALEPEHRAALVLRELEGAGHAEISAIMGWSLSKTKVTIHRAKRRLARILEEAMGDASLG